MSLSISVSAGAGRDRLVLLSLLVEYAQKIGDVVELLE